MITRAPTRVLVIGISREEVCGVRDQAERLSHALVRRGVVVRTVWPTIVPGRDPVLRAFRGEIRKEIERWPPDLVLLHYSVFAFSWKGVPGGVPLLAAVLRNVGTPVVLIAHEFAFRWGRDLRVATWALTQRMAMAPLFAIARVVVATTEERRKWLASRWWLPHRALILAPVYSNIERVSRLNTYTAVVGRVGVFSFGAENVDIEMTVAAVSAVARRRPGTHLLMIGMPGQKSPAGKRWREAADRLGCALDFTDVVDNAVVSEALETCEVLLFLDPQGPSTRKTSLMAALVHGRPTIAFRGANLWPELAEARAVTFVDATASALAGRLDELLGNERARRLLGERAASFVDGASSPEATAAAILTAITAAAVSAVHPGLIR